MSGETKNGDTQALDRVIAGLGAVCAVLLAADFAVDKHAHFRWQGWFASYALFGFASYTFIVFAGRWLRALVMRREDYYE